MRKIIHVDMDCFYAAVEERDTPSLKDKPLAIGGDGDNRGVLCTCNYHARRYGLHAAMPTAIARQKCPDLVLVSPNIAKYKKVSDEIRQIFYCVTDKVEPLSLDEAYLDVTDSPYCQGSATRIALKIREVIKKRLDLTASAGIAENKLLAKIASDINKPNGQCVVSPDKTEDFLKDLPVSKLFGVGPKLTQKLKQQGIFTCGELQQQTLSHLIQHHGKMGVCLYQYCRGIDNRQVVSSRVMKSISVEHTFSQDDHYSPSIEKIIMRLYDSLNARWQRKEAPEFKSIFIKIKFADFQSITREVSGQAMSLENYIGLIKKAASESPKAIRLIGLGLRLKEQHNYAQLEFDFRTYAGG